MAGHEDLILFIHDSCAENSGRKNQQHKDREEQQVNASLQNIGLSAGKRNDADGQG
jgi:hypothetical protein